LSGEAAPRWSVGHDVSAAKLGKSGSISAILKSKDSRTGAAADLIKRNRDILESDGARGKLPVITDRPGIGAIRVR